MGSPYQHIKELVDFLGIDLRSSNVSREIGYASDGTRNIIHSTQGGLTQRPGNKIAAGSTYLGLTRFDTVDITGTKKTEIIGFATGSAAPVPFRLVNGTFVLTNNSASQSAVISHYYVPASSQFVFKAVVGGSLEVSYSVGNVADGLAYKLISELCTNINLSSHVSVVAPSNAASVPACFMEIIADVVVAALGTLAINYYYWEQVNCPGGVGSNYATLINVAAEVGSSSYSNVSTAVINNVLYMSTGVHTLVSLPLQTAKSTVNITKYDGQNFYRAGVLTPLANPAYALNYNAVGFTSPQTLTDDVKGNNTLASASSIASRSYRFTYICIDKAGNRTESSSFTTPGMAVGGNPISQVTVQDPDATLGFNNAFGICSTGATSTTIACAVHQTLLAGDIAYFWDNGQQRFIQRRVVTATANTSMVVDTVSLDTNPYSPTYDTGATPHLLANALITNNMRIGIFRNVGSGSGPVWYLLDEVPNWNVSATTDFNYSYYDVYADADISGSALHPAWIEPQYSRDVPAPGKYLSAFNGQLIISGDEASPNTVYFSDSDGPEYMPRATHNFNLPVACTGHGQSAEVLACFGDTRTFAVVGDLVNFNFRVEFIADQIGCTSHGSIQRLDEGMLAFSSRKGPYVMFGGRQIVPMGMKSYPDGSKVSRLEPFFTARPANQSGTAQPCFERLISAILPQDRLYILFVPYEDPAVPSFATSASICFAYDWGRDAWWKYDGLNMAGGMTELNGQLYFNQRYFLGGSVNISEAEAFLWQEQRDKGQYNYADHNALTNVNWRSHWEALGQPGMFKRFLRCRISSYEPRLASSIQMNLNSYVNYNDTLLSNFDTLTWTTQLDLKPKLKSEVVRSMQFEFATSQFYQPVLITGFELEAVADFRQEMKE